MMITELQVLLIIFIAIKRSRKSPISWTVMDCRRTNCCIMYH